MNVADIEVVVDRVDAVFEKAILRAHHEESNEFVERLVQLRNDVAAAIRENR